MKAGVIVFPGSNCDRDMAVALQAASGAPAEMIWHKETSLPPSLDLVAIPGGFSFGDFLRCGAIAARAPIMRSVAEFAARGGHVLGVCNGFQVMIEAGLLPGALMRNGSLKFVCRTVGLQVESTSSPFTAHFATGQKIALPVAHHDGNYVAEEETLARLSGEARIAFRYLDNPNGSVADIEIAKGNPRLARKPGERLF
ncbi:MAG: phosphoribosylformylglycinamidine synthase subunit PurQ, partial [Pseudomonadota bacterium]